MWEPRRRPGWNASVEGRVSRPLPSATVAPSPSTSDGVWVGLREDDHAARDLAPAHRREPLVDGVQLDAFRYQLVEFEPALQVEIDVARHIDAEPVRAHVRSLDLFLIQEIGPGNLDFLA